MKITILPTLLTVLLFTFSSCNKNTNQIYNSKDLSNWNFVLEDNTIPAEEVYYVEDEIIIVKGEPLRYMYTKEKFSDFTLDLEYRWAGEESNSGVFVLIEDPTNPFPRGIECQLKYGQAGDFVLLSGSELNEYVLPEGITERPEFPVIDKINSSSENPAGEWNHVKIIVDKGEITVFVNDVLQNRATSTVMEGHIGLQSEGEEIHFRNIEIS